MAGIYIHVPFCKKACHYCDFHFSTQLDYQPLVVNALITELENRAFEFKNTSVNTLYFGGGTPSLLTKDELSRIISAVYKNYVVEKDIEITLEANPDDLDKKNLLSLKDNLVNRLSIGVQSLNDEVLSWMNRSHNATQGLEAIKLAQDIGFNNISVDLIYGHPFLQLTEWKKTIEQILSLQIQHVSSYCLTIENNTVFGNQLKKGNFPEINEELANTSLELLNNLLSANKMIHYEVSNWALKDYISQHNSSYWKSIHYLGIGPSAHSFDGDTRRWNLSNNQLYIKNIEEEKIFYETEDLTNKDRLNEYLLTRLRTHWGADLSVIHSFDQNIQNDFYKNLQESAFSKYLQKDSNRIFINEKDWIWADRIAAELFVE